MSLDAVSVRPVAARPRLGYRPELDGVRGIAVLLVLLAHSSAFLPSGAGVLYSGFFGVDVFFVLSGFLITTLLLEERTSTGRVRLSSFYRRRAWRLLPALVFGVGLAGLATLVVGANLRGAPFPQAALYSLGFVANWSHRSLGFLAHAWSLAVEAQYYVVWPLLVVVCVRRGVRTSRLVWAAVAGAVVIAMLRALALHGHGSTHLIHGIYRVDAIMLGSALGAVLFVDRERVAAILGRRTTRWSALAALAAYVAYAEIGGRLGRASDTKDLLFVGTAAVAVLLGRVVTALPGVVHTLASRPFVTIGKLSYSLYLVHYPIFRTLGRTGPENAWASAVTGWLLSFALAAACYACIERPALVLKDRLAARRRVRLLDGEGVRRRRDPGLEVQGGRGEEELVDAV